jgi:hypothetical protein
MFLGVKLFYLRYGVQVCIALVHFNFLSHNTLFRYFVGVDMKFSTIKEGPVVQ